MTKLMFACVAALALTACPHKSSNDSAAALSKMTEFKDKMCGCKTPACATDVTTEMTKWSQEMAKANGDKAPMSPEENKKFTAISEELAKCSADAAKVAVPEAPPTPVVPEATGSGSGSATK